MLLQQFPKVFEGGPWRSVDSDSDPGQIVHSQVPLLSNGIIWYRRKLGR